MRNDLKCLNIYISDVGLVFDIYRLGGTSTISTKVSHKLVYRNFEKEQSFNILSSVSSNIWWTLCLFTTFISNHFFVLHVGLRTFISHSYKSKISILFFLYHEALTGVAPLLHFDLQNFRCFINDAYTFLL